MGIYILKRLLSSFITIIFVTFVAFTLINIIPVDPAEVAVRVSDVPLPTEELIQETRIKLGLDKPYLVRYWDWVVACAQLDFGVPFNQNGRTVAEELARSFPYTLQLASISLFFVLIISFPIGILGAVYKDGWFDRLSRLVVFTSTSVPNYWLALLLIWLFSIKFNILPSGGATSWYHFIMPAIAQSSVFCATYVRLIRNSMLENMKENYVIYARSRGISEFFVICKHVLRNSLQSSMTSLGIGIVRLLSGTVVLESIFSIPGLGRLCLTAIYNRDYPVIQAYVLVMACLFVFTNLLIDILSCYVDPRLKKRVQK